MFSVTAVQCRYQSPNNLSNFNLRVREFSAMNDWWSNVITLPNPNLHNVQQANVYITETNLIIFFISLLVLLNQHKRKEIILTYVQTSQSANDSAKNYYKDTGSCIKNNECTSRGQVHNRMASHLHNFALHFKTTGASRSVSGIWAQWVESVVQNIYKIKSQFILRLVRWDSLHSDSSATGSQQPLLNTRKAYHYGKWTQPMFQGHDFDFKAKAKNSHQG